MTASGRKRYTFRDYLSPRVLTMLALGFSSGLPFLLVGNTFGFWLSDEGTTLKAIGFLSWVGIAYSLQFLWSPLLDRVPALKFLGQRRGWMVLSQVFTALGLFAMAFVGTRHGLTVLGACALLVAFASATQDIAISAWRIEIADDADELGLLTSANTLGYRVALLCTDALILIAAQHLGWPASYTICGAAMGVGLLASLFAGEPEHAERVLARKELESPLWTPRGFFDAVAGPFLIFFKTHGAAAVLMLLAISFYRLPDFVRGPMTNPFFSHLGLSKDVVGMVRGTVGLGSIFAGVAAGGYLSLRLGYMRALILAGILQAIGIAAYALLALMGPNIPAFVAIMMFDDFALGAAGVTLVAYMSSLTSLGYTATQYALLSSTYAWAGKILKGFSGAAVEGMAAQFGLMNGFALFFIGCGIIGVPSLILFGILERQRPKAVINPA
jgi:PAT family beta-lactamase induction signal transducer AmpG